MAKATWYGRFGHREQLGPDDVFRRAWEQAAEAGQADTWCGAECLRVWQEWVAARCKIPPQQFIRERANIGPNG